MKKTKVSDLKKEAMNKSDELIKGLNGYSDLSDIEIGTSIYKIKFPYGREIHVKNVSNVSFEHHLVLTVEASLTTHEDLEADVLKQLEGQFIIMFDYWKQYAEAKGMKGYFLIHDYLNVSIVESMKKVQNEGGTLVENRKYVEKLINYVVGYNFVEPMNLITGNLEEVLQMRLNNSLSSMCALEVLIQEDMMLVGDDRQDIELLARRYMSFQYHGEKLHIHLDEDCSKLKLSCQNSKKKYVASSEAELRKVLNLIKEENSFKNLITPPHPNFDRFLTKLEIYITEEKMDKQFDWMAQHFDSWEKAENISKRLYEESDKGEKILKIDREQTSGKDIKITRFKLDNLYLFLVEHVAASDLFQRDISLFLSEEQNPSEVRAFVGNYLIGSE